MQKKQFYDTGLAHHKRDFITTIIKMGRLESKLKTILSNFFSNFTTDVLNVRAQDYANPQNLFLLVKTFVACRLKDQSMTRHCWFNLFSFTLQSKVIKI